MPYLYEPSPRGVDDEPYDDPTFVSVPFPHGLEATADEVEAWFDEFVTGGHYAVMFEDGERKFRLHEGSARPSVWANVIFMTKCGGDPKVFFKDREDAVRFQMKWTGRFPGG